ncbi:MAG: hypothetical protein ACRYG8_37095 [Janthinobacterium lividum]
MHRLAWVEAGKLAQVLNVESSATRQISLGKQPISPELARWLERN